MRNARVEINSLTWPRGPNTIYTFLRSSRNADSDDHIFLYEMNFLSEASELAHRLIGGQTILGKKRVKMRKTPKKTPGGAAWGRGECTHAILTSLA